ncbi:MAG: glycogen synthase GlgA [Syntrophobacteraceae bacterium]
MKKPKILFCSSEVSPYSKTGGLADVAGVLPQALQELGCDVRIFTPLYRCVRDRVDSLDLLSQNIPIPVGIHNYHVHLRESRTASGIPLYFLEKDEFFDRTHLYGTPVRGDYEDNAERFVAFCRAVYPLCTELDWYPEIFHLHDWQAALVSAYLAGERHNNPNLTSSGTVFTIHNLAYQGVFPGDHFSLTGLPPGMMSIQGMEFWGNCNFLKAGLVYSDFLTTVSSQYSKEIQRPEYGSGLDGVLRERSRTLAGIINGVDYNVWNPETDPMIPANFNAGDLSGKRTCKEALISELGLPRERIDMPLFGMIGRLDEQKGFDLVSEIIEDLMELPISLVILGVGDAKIEEGLLKTAGLYPDKLRVLLQFDEQLAHRIEAGADIFLMPSRFEPCGLNQLYSLRYGTIPVVHATGGLYDSVDDVHKNPDSGTGFKFYAYKASGFFAAIRLALEFHENKDKWLALQLRAFAQDFSWNRSAQEYLKIYRRIIAARSSSGSEIKKQSAAGGSRIYRSPLPRRKRQSSSTSSK